VQSEKLVLTQSCGPVKAGCLEQFPRRLSCLHPNPKRHVVSFFDVTGGERKAMLALLDSAKLGLDAAFHPDGYNVGINDGEAAGQTVPHLHLHLIPRYAGDREDPRGGVRWVLPQKAKYWP
jgi:diadenosine tetraphosphate (Ap4A) HIT family hydrolase